MSELSRNQFKRPVGCPIQKMTFGEILRFLHGKYEPPIQKTISAHVEHCMSCQQVISEVEALREAGHNAMQDQLVEIELQRQEEVEAYSTHPDEAELAAFVENGLSVPERQTVAKHLGECHICYKLFVAIEKDLKLSSVAEILETPPQILKLMKVKLNTPFGRVEWWLREFANRLVGMGQRVWDQGWAAPAVGFAVGVFLMILITLPQEKQTNLVVLLPTIQTVSTNESGHVLSGLPPSLSERSDLQAVISQIEIPYLPKSDILFKWPIVPGCMKYRVGFFDAVNKPVLEIETSREQLSISSSHFAPQESYSVQVIGVYHQGEVGVVAKMGFQFTR